MSQAAISDDLWPCFFYWAHHFSCLAILTTSKRVHSIISPTDKARAYIRRALLRPSRNDVTIQAIFESAFCRNERRYTHYPTALMIELIRRGANPRIKNDEALLHACREGNEPVVRYLLEKIGADVHTENALFEASRLNHAGVVRILLDSGADVHINNNQPLRWACRRGAAEVVQLLVQAGADVHADDDIALLNASAEGHADVVEILLEAGAHVDAGDGAALIEASRYAKEKVVRMLIQAGADVQARNYKALGKALRYGHSEIVRLLDLAAGFSRGKIENQ